MGYPKHKSDEHKRKIRESQPASKEVSKLSKKGRVMKHYSSVTRASIESGVNRDNIKAVLHGRRKYAGGYVWIFRLTFGEEIVKRTGNLDFSLPLDTVLRSIYLDLPARMNREDTLKYYTKKFKIYWNKK